MIIPTPLSEFNSCHSPADGKFCSTGSAAQRQHRVGITSATKDVTDPGVIKHHMEGFARALKKLPGVSRPLVQFGEGGYKGGSEPTWVVSYRGNGEARRLIAQTAKYHNQEAVLLMSGCRSAARCQPMVELTFDRPLQKAKQGLIETSLADTGFGGWTWFRNGSGKTVLRVTSVPQWGGDRHEHLGSTQRLSRALTHAGIGFSKSVKNVRVEVMGQKGPLTYDDVLRRAR